MTLEENNLSPSVQYFYVWRGLTFITEISFFHVVHNPNIAIFNNCRILSAPGNPLISHLIWNFEWTTLNFRISTIKRWDVSTANTNFTSFRFLKTFLLLHQQPLNNLIINVNGLYKQTFTLDITIYVVKLCSDICIDNKSITFAQYNYYLFLQFTLLEYKILKSKIIIYT